MDPHKERCKALKKVRKTVADTLNIDLHQTECTYEGPCSGTCPKCKQEEQILNQALLKTTAAVAAAATVGVTMTACTNPFSGRNQIAGDMSIPTTEEMQLEGEATLDPDYDTSDSSEDMNTCEVNTEEGDGDSSTEIQELEGDVAMPVDVEE